LAALLVSGRAEFEQTAAVVCLSSMITAVARRWAGLSGLDARQKTVFFCSPLRQDGRILHQLSLKSVPEAFSSKVNRELTDHLTSASSRG